MIDRQRGFASMEIIILAVLVVLVGGFVGWRVFNAKDKNQSNLISGPLTAEDQKILEELQSNGAETAAADKQSSDTGSGQSNQSGASASSSSKPKTSTSNSSANQPSSSSGSSNSGDSGSSSPTPTPTPSTITRPTAAFCQQQKGENFSNSAWVTDNSTHNYTIWENGAPTNKSGTGTAMLNYDSMQVVAVLPYLTKAGFAHCSDKAGYVAYYYRPPGSVSDYFWLVPFEHISITQP